MADRHWKSLQEWEAGVAGDGFATDEFIETPLDVPAGPDRRGFLKAAGFSVAAAWFSSCTRAPEKKALPHLIQPEGLIPGRSYDYASTCAACPAGCGVLVKVRDGRPIKLEGNPDHPLSRGGLCAVGQASILGLYDSLRLRRPMAAQKVATWEAVDRDIMARLDEVRRRGGAVRLLTGTVHGPTERAAILSFLATFKDARHIQYDPLSCSAILEAHHRSFGLRAVPRYRFDRAEVIASFDADFLGTWISPVEFTAGCRARRDPEEDRFSYHMQVESRMSLTGMRADRRYPVAQGEIGALLAGVAKELEGGSAGPQAAEIAARLRMAEGKSLVVCGINDAALQVLANQINQRLGNYGATLDLARPSKQRLGNDRDVESLFNELEAGKVAALLVAGANPLYDLPGGEVVRKVPLLISLSQRSDETAAAAHYVCPVPHWLEAWSDAEPADGLFAVLQPVIQPLGQGRTVAESLAVWSGQPQSATELVKAVWQKQVFPRQAAGQSFDAFWERAVHDGFVEVPAATPAARQPDPGMPAQNAPAAESETGAFTLVLYPKLALLDGRHAYNPWLQELSDPVSKVTWDNYACLGPAAAAGLGVSDGDVIRLDAGGTSLELPAFVQPGQHDQTVAVALGYGSRLSERFGRVGPRWLEGAPGVGANGLVGVNAAPLLAFERGALRYARSGVRLSRTGQRRPLASTQDHHSLKVPPRLAPAAGERRPIVQETTVEEWQRSGLGKTQRDIERPELWPRDHPFTGQRWAMVVDLNACTGCSACVVACQVENNIPVVGKDEVRRKRAMHWLRIDRYYAGPPGDPQVVHQPMFCQQCEHAPCETVCPVLATVHSDEGLNQQVYNRCVGTRYCANNCPYKARRFNWFHYAREDALANMVLNPDVTVRSRGVMEKCTFCVQRIQEAKLEAKRQGRPLRDGRLQTACQQSCPAQAIHFGDLNDPNSKVAQLMASGRRYRVLEELNVRPSVGYLKVVRHHGEAEGEKKEHG